MAIRWNRKHRFNNPKDDATIEWSNIADMQSGPEKESAKLEIIARWKAAEDQLRSDKEKITFQKLSTNSQDTTTIELSYAQICARISNVDPLKPDDRILQSCVRV